MAHSLQILALKCSEKAKIPPHTGINLAPCFLILNMQNSFVRFTITVN